MPGPINPARTAGMELLNNRHIPVTDGTRDKGIAQFTARVENALATTGQSGSPQKNTPYFSPKRDEQINLNGRVKSVTGTRIVCRHLTDFWAADFTRNHGKVDYSQLSAPDAVQCNISPETFDRTPPTPAIVRLVRNSEWGSVFAESFRDMTTCGDNHRVQIIRSKRHEMAAGLKCKVSPEGKKYIIQFYDPNHTVAHKRAVFQGDSNDSLSQIERLTANDFLMDIWLKLYQFEDDNNFLAFLDSHAPVPATKLARLPDNPLHPDVLYHCMALGLADGLTSAAERLDGQLKNMPHEKVRALLTAKNNNDTPCLAMALQNGHADAIRVYGEMVLKAQAAGLPTESVTALLTAMRYDSIPGLRMALQYGHAGAIRVYGEIVLKAQAAGLQQESVTALLAAKRNDGPTCLLLALLNGHTGAIRAYGEIVRAAQAAGLPAESVTALLTTKRKDGTPGLLQALQNGHTEAIRAYDDIVRAAGLPAESVAALLATPSQGSSAME